MAAVVPVVPVARGAEPAGLPPNTSNGLRLLEEMQTVITELAEAAKPSVVSLFPINLTGKGREFMPERMPNAPGSGAGVIITPDGHIITNNHVVGDATEIEVRLSDKSKLIGQVVGKDPDTDLAVLKVASDHPLPNAAWNGRSRSVWSAVLDAKMSICPAMKISFKPMRRSIPEIPAGRSSICGGK
jgi:serine protease Do